MAPKTPETTAFYPTSNGAPTSELYDDNSAHGSVPTPESALAAPHRPGGEPTDGTEAPARANRLVPTNAVHTTKRRQRRASWHGHVAAVAVAGAIIGLLILGGRNEPPDVSPLERQSASTVTGPSDDADQFIPRDSAAVESIPANPSRASADPATSLAPRQPARKTAVSAIPNGLNLLEIVEIERMLVRLDLDPSAPDGIVDSKTESAIRMYQQIAGLPEDGKPSKDLLDDMREVVKILDKSE